MLQALWRALGRPALCGAALLSVANLVHGQGTLPTPGTPPMAPAARVQADSTDDLRARIERLEKQNQELIDAIKALRTTPVPAPIAAEPNADALTTNDVQKIVNDYLAAREAQVNEGQAVPSLITGGPLNLSGAWKNNQYWFETPDKAFRLHVGGRTQFDIIGTALPDNVEFGQGGLGRYEDGVNFRRARLTLEGTFWEVFDFTAECDFVNTTQAIGSVDFNTRTAETATFNTPVPTELWITWTQIPWFGNLRIGNHKPWLSFEHLTSSRYLNFLERSYQFDAFIEDGNNGFTPGISVFNNWGPDQNGMWALGAYKTTRSIFGWNTGDGEWGGVARATWLPVYRDEGRHLVHLGMGAQFRDLDEDQIRLRARTLLRQSPALLHNISAIAQTNGSRQFLLNPEFVVNHGPFTLQAEYTYSEVYGVSNIIRTPTQTNEAIASRTFRSQGFYVEGLCFLTGEHRLYDKKIGAFTRVVPHRNYYLIHGTNNERLFQSGAWQVGVRYSYLDLNDGPIRGGQLNDITVGLNWFLNPNFKIQGNYSYGHRTVDAVSNGPYHGAGVRFALDW